jgi:hypothetical protein
MAFLFVRGSLETNPHPNQWDANCPGHFKRFNGKLKKGSYMEIHRIGSCIVLACFLLSSIPAIAAVDVVDKFNEDVYQDMYGPNSLDMGRSAAPEVPFSTYGTIFDTVTQEKSKTQWGAGDFQKAGIQARENGYYAGAIQNFNKAEELIVGKYWADGTNELGPRFLSYAEQDKASTYKKWPGHEKEAAAAQQKAIQQKNAADKIRYDNEESDKFTKCLIVTSTFGSPLSSEVQLVRSFRDDSIQQSYTGSRFMPGFNAWYYSFSPQVSTYINQHPFVKPAMQVILSPLLWIVRVSQIGYSFLAFSPELATFAALVIGSTLYACLYVFPFVLVAMWVAQRRGWKGWDIRSMKPVAGVWAAIAVLLVLGVLLSVDFLTTVASGLFVIATIILVAGGLSLSLIPYTHTQKTS